MSQPPDDDPPPPTHPPLDAWNEDWRRRSRLPSDQTAHWWSSGRDLPSPFEPDEGREETGGDEPGAGSSSGDALDLVHRSGSAPLPFDLATEMAERFALDDFTGALRAAELLLGKDPQDPVAQHYARESRDKLEGMLFARLTRHGTVPRVCVPEEEVPWLGLDPYATSLLSRIDGVRDCVELLGAQGTDRLEALRAMVRLLDCGAITLGPAWESPK